jgi:signal peptidase I
MNRPFKQYMSIFMRGWIGSILVALLIATSFRSAIADWYVVPTGSMKPTILEGDRIFANKLAYDLKVPYTTLHIASWDDPKRGDIVVFNSPADRKCLVKRVVGIPGDIVAMRNNQLSINGEILRYDSFDIESLYPSISSSDAMREIYIEDLTGHKHKTMVMPYQPSVRSFVPVAVPDGHYFMMGDNRDNSADSRYFGFVDRKEILARATAIVISLDIQHDYQPRWPRFFTRLQ